MCSYTAFLDCKAANLRRMIVHSHYQKPGKLKATFKHSTGHHSWICHATECSCSSHYVAALLPSHALVQRTSVSTV
jgi:hypothetical protein